MLRRLTEDTRDVLWQTDTPLRPTYISPADERLRGFKADEVLGRHIFGMFTEEGIAVIQQKIQALAKLQDQVHNLAFYDPLTQLANRRLLVDRLTQTLVSYQRQPGHGALLFLDLDNFKALNDAHGHGAGDLLLIEVAQRLKTCVRAIDTVARFGGDEFLVLLDTLGSDAAAQAGAIAEKIRVSLAQPYQIALTPTLQPPTTVEHHCSASIGVVLFGAHGAHPNEIIDKADAAMYRAKEEGRNRVCFDRGHTNAMSVAKPETPLKK